MATLKIGHLFEKRNRVFREALCDVLDVTDEKQKVPRWVLIGRDVTGFPGYGQISHLNDAFEFLSWLRDGSRMTYDELLQESKPYLRDDLYGSLQKLAVTTMEK